MQYNYTFYGTVPVRYRKLEYIIFSGSEYIILDDYKPTNNKSYELQFSLSEKGNDKFILGCNGDNTSDGTMRCTVRTSSSSNYFQRRYGRNSSSNVALNYASVTLNAKYALLVNIHNDFKANWKVEGNYQTGTSSESTAQTFTPANMNPFAIMGYGQGTTATNLSKGRVYQFSVREGGVVSNYMVPVQRKSDGICGLWDSSLSKFYPMQGANIRGTAAGPIAQESFDGSTYRRLEYINFTGDQYIDPAMPSRYSFYYAQFKFDTSTLNSGFNRIMSTHNTYSSSIKYVDIGIYKNGSYVSPVYVYSDTESDVTSLGEGFNYLNDSHLYEAKWRTYGNDYNHWLCITDLDTDPYTDYGYYTDDPTKTYTAGDLDSTGLNLMQGTKGNLYKAYERDTDDNSSIVHEWIPVQRKSDGKCGLLDVFNFTFYFIWGEGGASPERAGPVVDENYY